MRTARRPLLAAALAMPALARAQARYPDRPITLIVPYPPGGSSDNVSRPIQMPLSAALGQNIVIENRGGAGGSIGAAAVAQARPDGYTLLVWPTAVLTISPHMMRLPYDPAKDFTPIAMLAASDGVMAMHPRVPARSMPEFLAYARANPGKLRFSSAGNGTITQMTGEIFASAAGIRLEHVPYRGSAPAFTALLAGEVELQFDPVATPAVKDGRLIGLATTGETRSPELPELPTLRELGLYGEGGLSFFGLAGPAGLPVAVVDRLVTALGPVLALPEVARAMAPVGLRPRLEAGEAFAQRIAQDRAIFGEMVRRTGARAE
ncbi:tripartite tricarboxylate transporter substrate binding protein [Siccirubricoccus phaeus]|uniref:tripartite tricarboxylate transporter substrate binding protein n=1 Tax=Siccirubricoccus phaeus TaxID=2595053 RepID=UPI0011F3127D|nr:tripartite tricarboxylate transporter substrate binding protein [Siccirubricoccus phaeus]